MDHLKRFVRVGLCVPVVASLLNAPPALAAHAVVVRVTLTSVWSTPSPDPMGITYDPRSRRLLISDSEVDEMPTLWKGSNLFIAQRKGNLFARRTFKKFTVEPEDLALNNRARVLYVTDDDLDRVFKDKPGKDGLFGTRDDVAVTILRTHRFGSFDPEGLTWYPLKKMLIVSDSTSRRIYKIRQGKDRRFGTRDDIIRSFGIHRYGFTTAEDVVMTRFTHHLLIVSSRQRFILETTMNGALIRKIDLTGIGIKAASGITFAPGTDGSRSRLYITDSGVDNNVNPAENDGRVFELKIVP